MEYVNNEKCPTCHGRKIIPSAEYHIENVCPGCNGLGHRDWISLAMGQNEETHIPNTQLKRNICMENITNMTHAIIAQYRKMGVEVRVDIKFIRHDIQISEWRDINV